MSLPEAGETVSLFLILRAFAYLTLYNALFVLPLGVILVAASARPTLHRLAHWNIRHREGLRLGMGLGCAPLG